MNIHVGDEIELTEEVVPENTAEKWGSGSLPVYATPAMISLIEQSAVNLLAGKLEEGQTTVGTNLNIAHVSATPVGGTIKCHCSLTEIDRKRLVFHVEVTDNKGRVGIGTHERFIVASEPFMEKAAKKIRRLIFNSVYAKGAGILIPTPFSYLLIYLFPLRLGKSSCR